MTRLLARALLFALAMLAGAAVLPVPVHAQFFGGWGSDEPERSGPPPRSFFSFPFFGRPYSRSYAPPVESYRAPPPRKLETQPASTVVVIGDSMADWLAYGLEEIYADNPQIGIVRKVKLNAGLIHYEPRNDSLQWSQVIKDALATEQPSAIVVMLGLDDRLALRAPSLAPKAGEHEGKQSAAAPSKQKSGEAPAQGDSEGVQQPAENAAGDASAVKQPVPGDSYEFRTDEWAKLYAKRIDDMITALKSKGVPVLWVGLPAIRGPRATSDMSYLDDLYHEAADRTGITYVDIWEGFVNDDGRYSVEGPDFEGQIRRLRTSDGVHFTKYGALTLAHLVDQQLGRVLTNPSAPVALPSPQASAPAQPGAARPAIGPVLPLTAGGGYVLDPGASASLLGSGGQPAPIASEDPTVQSVLVHGDPLPAPLGRADNFKWPPTAADAKPAPQPKPASAAPASDSEKADTDH